MWTNYRNKLKILSRIDVKICLLEKIVKNTFFSEPTNLFVSAFALLYWQHFHRRFKDSMKNCDFFVHRQVEDSFSLGAKIP